MGDQIIITNYWRWENSLVIWHLIMRCIFVILSPANIRASGTNVEKIYNMTLNHEEHSHSKITLWTENTERNLSRQAIQACCHLIFPFPGFMYYSVSLRLHVIMEYGAYIMIKYDHVWLWFCSLFTIPTNASSCLTYIVHIYMMVSLFIDNPIHQR